ncbi:MAG: acetylxylan esterase, partial [Actinomycetota bacterium]|nr:acetylxylan esterase [Actinomycetota bacterium]
FTFLAFAPPAQAAITSVFSNTATPIPCVTQGGGVRLCDQTTFSPAQARSTIKTFDGVPIDVRVAFPPAPVSGPDGPYPLIMMFHGYAGSKISLASMQPWLNKGYATLSMTTRGFGESCGTSAARSADSTGCANGYVRLLDSRYEVRDAQDLAGLLADEGRTSATQIGAIGGSYGGGLSMALAALKDRKMLPGGSLVPWTSPLGTPMRIAAATPEIPWTDLAASLTPNGTTLDYVADAPYTGRSGVLKESFENALYNSGLSFFYAPAGADPSADLRNWHTTMNNGEPYDDASGNPLPASAAIRNEITTHHSSYYIDHSETPAPLLISNGWTDDLFPPDEAIRFYNRTRTEHTDAAISLFFMSFGHPRGQNKAADQAVLTTREQAWMDYFVKGTGGLPFLGVETLTQTCPTTAASGGPYSAANWAALAPGEVRLNDPASKTILPSGGDFTVAVQFDPISGGGACQTTSSADSAGTATYRSAAVPAGGYTLMGSPTVVADITSPGSNSQIAARLLDVDPGTSNQTLVARGLWRPAINGSAVHQVFQLHPNGYKFAAGHVVKLELLPNDNPSYGRVSNGQANVTISNLELRLPVLEAPGSLGGVVQAPVAKVLPPGYALARDFGPATYARPKGATPARASLVPAFKPCVSPGNDTHGAPLSHPSCNPPVQASGFLTVGTPDANGAGAGAIGSVLHRVKINTPPTPNDVLIDVSTTDVRCQLPVNTTCGSANAAAGPDYTGQLQATSVLRLTDELNGPSTNEAGTVSDTSFPVTVPCAATAADPTIGSTCSISTSANAVVPGVVQVAGSRAIWQLGQVKVFDGGASGVAGSADATLFMDEGVFVP